jgi:hypothetical protein
MVRVKKRGPTPQKNAGVSKGAFRKVGFCMLPSCRRRFFVKRSGKRKQRFCCPEHKKEFEVLIYQVGKAVLRICTREFKRWNKQQRGK